MCTCINIIAVILVILCLALMFSIYTYVDFFLSAVNSGALLLERLGSHGLWR
jgi:uncharacterized membrane protein